MKLIMGDKQNVLQHVKNPEVFWIVLTLIVIIIVIWLARDKVSAIIAVTSIVTISSLVYSKLKEKKHEACDTERLKEEDFDPELTSAKSCGSQCKQKRQTKQKSPTKHVEQFDEFNDYPGAVDLKEFEVDTDSSGDEDSWTYGHKDRGRHEKLKEGNPYNKMRYSAPQAAEADIDDEADDYAMDGDERIVQNAQSRNDAERVIAGTMNRRKALDPYLREELEEEEDRRWWGQHET